MLKPSHMLKPHDVPVTVADGRRGATVGGHQALRAGRPAALAQVQAHPLSHDPLFPGTEEYQHVVARRVRLPAALLLERAVAAAALLLCLSEAALSGGQHRERAHLQLALLRRRSHCHAEPRPQNSTITNQTLCFGSVANVMAYLHYC